MKIDLTVKQSRVLAGNIKQGVFPFLVLETSWAEMWGEHEH